MTAAPPQADVAARERVIWHRLECGRYRGDLALWLALAERYAAGRSARVLDVGAGVGRVSLTLARAGHSVLALERDRELARELERHQGGLAVRTLTADARAFTLPGYRFALCVVAMQTVQLLGGPGGRDAFLALARAHLAPAGVIAMSLVESEDVETYDTRTGDARPVPEVLAVAGRVYRSCPIAVRVEPDAIVLERRREVVDADGPVNVSYNRVALDRVRAAELEEAGRRAGLEPIGRRRVSPTRQHGGSVVVLLGR